jgi:YfiR/HmsC-like
VGASARARLAALALALCACAPAARAADDLPEYRLKAAFLYNFALFTEWPAAVGGTLQLCVFGTDPFGAELDGLHGKAVGERSIAVQRKTGIDGLKGCQIVFIAPAAAAQLPKVLDALEGQTVLTVADNAGAARQGVALNMAVSRNKVSFEANLKAARAARLNLSSKLLRLATEVIQ